MLFTAHGMIRVRPRTARVLALPEAQCTSMCVMCVCVWGGGPAVSTDRVRFTRDHLHGERQNAMNLVHLR